MAGPSLSGPLTGWTSSTLTPVAASTPGGMQIREEQARYKDAKKRADSLEATARASGDKKALEAALDAQVQAAQILAIEGPGESQIGRARKALSEFKDRNPSVPLSSWATEVLKLPEDDPQLRITPEQVTGIANRKNQFKEVFNSLGVRGSAAGAPGASGMTAARSTGSGRPEDYNLSDSDYGSGLGPDRRVQTKPLTPLESLLSAIYPDAAAGSGTDPLLFNARTGEGGPSSVIANVLSNLGTAPSGGSGYVPSPMLSGGVGPGANIASTIPGAPGFLAGAINNVAGFGQPTFQPAPAAGGGVNLAGIAALSAEQRVQEAQMKAENLARQQRYIAQVQAQQQAQQSADQIARQRAGGVVGANGWSSPSFNFTPWQPNFPTY